MSGVFAQAIDRKILHFIHQSVPEGSNEEEFNRVALDIFAYQFAHNMPYRMYCMQRRATPDQIYSWEDIPAVTTAAFKSAAFGCFLPHMAVRVFETSGTTTGKRGKHYLDSLVLYDESAIPNFGQHLLPDGAHLPMRILLPTPEEAPDGGSGAYRTQLDRRHLGSCESCRDLAVHPAVDQAAKRAPGG